MNTKVIKKEAPFYPEGFGDVEVTIDPLKKFNKVPRWALYEATGLIPYFIMEAPAKGDTQQVAQVLLECYGFGMPQSYNMMDDEAASLDTEGVYRYTEDEDMYPLVQFDLEHTTIYVYQYGLVAVVDAQTQWMQRFD